MLLLKNEVLYIKVINSQLRSSFFKYEYFSYNKIVYLKKAGRNCKVITLIYKTSFLKGAYISAL